VSAVTFDRRLLLLGLAGTFGIAAIVAFPGVVRDEVVEALAALADANPAWLWLAGSGFLGALLCSALAWRAATGVPDPVDAAARYGVGSLVNSVVPMHAGDAVRLALFAQASPNGGLLKAGRALAGVGVTRLACAGILLLAAIQPFALAALALVSMLGRVPAWVTAATAGRVVAATAIAASVGVDDPFLTALLVVPAIDLAGALALTPGNLGVKSGAIAIALKAQGVDLTTALSTGLAFHAVETMVGITFGALCTLYLARARVPGEALDGAAA
jgi:uncharacterized membrane protein YbhN (UPF0104 family)